MPNNLAAFIPQIWSRRIIAKIDQTNVALSVMCNSDYQGEIANFGDTVQVRTYGNITVSDYTRGLSLVAQSLAPTVEPMLIDAAKAFVFDVDSLDQAQNDLSAVDGYTSRAGVSMSNAIDAFAFAKALAGAGAANAIGTTAVPINVTAAAAGTSVYDQVVLAGLKLDSQDVPQTGRWIVLTPYAKSLLLLDTVHFIRATALGDAVVQSGKFGLTSADAVNRGYLGQIAGFDAWASNHTASNGTYWACPFGQGKPICYAAQIPAGTVEAIRLIDSFGTRIRGLLLHGGKVFLEDSKRLGMLYIDNS